MPLPDFTTLPPEHLRLLQLAKEQHSLDVVPLQELKAGQTGAFLYLASVSLGNTRQVQHFVVKFDRVNERAKSSETERHRLAVSDAPEIFSRQNMPRLAYQFEQEGATALFYTLAGQSLQRFRTLASIERQSRLEALFAATNDYLLREWNADSTIEQALHPQTLLQKWLGYRLKPDGQIASFLKDKFAMDADMEGFLVQGQIFPNPLSYGLNARRWNETRHIDTLTGFQHGDLNIANILAKFAEDSEALEGYFLIDFALYKAGMPLLYDQRYLEMSYLIRELERAPFPKWVSFVDHFSRRDMPNPREVPAELAVACAVINAGRKSFEGWMHETHASLSDDLWGQFWLAGVAAGLNFCNKTALSTEARLAGLIYSAVHLKRYCTQFGIPLPADVRLLYDAGKSHEIASIHNKSAPVSNVRRNNLPIQPTSFIGRQAELTAVKDLLIRDVRLVTITGPGGVGKTSLALQVTHELQDSFVDGVFFISLAAITDSTLIIPTIAQTLGVIESPNRLLLDSLKEFLRDRQALLLLDNFEQIMSAAPLLSELLSACAGLRMLATSREALRLRGEHEFPLSPLALPDQPSVEILSQSPSIALFVQRAQAGQPDFKLSADNARAVAEICTRLDGLPLALELAAARIKLLPPQTMVARLQESPLQLLTSGARDLPVRQQTLRNTVQWSYDLLENDEKRTFRWLSVFVGGCTLEAAQSVGGSPASIDILESLVSKSLLRQTESEGAPRLTMLETIREFGLEQLSNAHEIDSAQRAHTSYYLTFAEEAEGGLMGAEQKKWLLRLDREQDNLRAALRWAIEHHEVDTAQRIAGALQPFWFRRGHWSEGRRWLEESLAMDSGATQNQSFRAKALYEAGMLARFQGDFARARMLCEQSLASYRLLDDNMEVLKALVQLSRISAFQDDRTATNAFLAEAASLIETLPDSIVKADAYTDIVIANTDSYVSQYPPTAAHYLAESERIQRAFNNQAGLALAVIHQGSRALLEGDYTLAGSRLDEAERLTLELDDDRLRTRVAMVRVQLDVLKGDFATARHRIENVLQRAGRRGDHHLPRGMLMLAAILHWQGLTVWSARIFGMVEVWSMSGQARPELAVFEQHYLLKDIRTEVRTQLGEEVFAREFAAGQRLKLEDLLTIPHPEGPSPESAAQARTASTFLPFEALTAREMDVFHLLAQDPSNPQIAKSLEGPLSFESEAEVNNAVRAKALLGAGTLARFQGDFARARMLLEQSLAFYRALADKTGVLMTLVELSRITAFQDDQTAKNAFLAEAVSLLETLPDTVVKAYAYSELATSMVGFSASAIQFPPEAASYMAESVRINRALNNPTGLALALVRQASGSLFTGDFTLMASPLEEAEHLALELGDERILSRLVGMRALFDVREGDFAAARRRLEDSLQRGANRGDHQASFVLQMLAAVLHGQGLDVWSARVLGLTEVLPHQTPGEEMVAAFITRFSGIGDNRAEVRAQLGDEAFAREIAAGHQLTLKDMLAIPHPPEPMSAAQAAPAAESAPGESLTTRELEVLHLLAQDLSNPQIAERLVVSRRTVDAHLRSIYDKLGVKSRDAAIRVAREQRLIPIPDGLTGFSESIRVAREQRLIP